MVSTALSVALLSQNPLRHAMLGLALLSHLPPLQVFPALRAADPLHLSFLLAPPGNRHPPGIGFVCPCPVRPVWMADHPHGFLDIHLQTHLVKEYHQNTKRNLEPP